MTVDEIPSHLRVEASTRTVRLFTSRWFVLLRHGLPLIVLIIVYWLLGSPPLVVLESLILIVLVIGLCTSAVRYITLAILSWLDTGQPKETLLELENGTLRLTLDDINETVPLADCERIDVSRKRWWVAPHLAFTIRRQDGYSRRVETNIDLPELRKALATISDTVLPSVRQQAREQMP